MALQLTVLAMILSLPASLSAQRLQGTVLESSSGGPLANVRLALVDSTGTRLDETLSNQAGTFLLRAPAPGEYYLLAEAFTYQTVFDGIFEFETRDALLNVQFRMQPKPLVLEGIQVEVQRAQTRRYLRSQGFYDRAEAGLGYHLGPDEIEDRAPHDLSVLLRRVPGVRVGNEGIRNLRYGCGFRIYVDGFPAPYMPSVHEIEAVEVYKGAATVPGEFSGMGNSCGVVLIWTKG